MEHNQNYILYWNHAGLELNRLTHSKTVFGPQQGPPISARALRILHMAIHNAYFTIHSPQTPDSFTTFLKSEGTSLNLLDLTGISDVKQAIAGAAITILEKLYSKYISDILKLGIKHLTERLNELKACFVGINAKLDSYKYG